MFGLELPEILLIIVAFAVLFGSNKIGKLANALGRFGGEFKKGQLEIEQEIDKAKEGLKAAAASTNTRKG